MTEISKSSWALDYDPNLDFRMLTEIFAPPEMFRVSKRRLPEGEETHGATRACKCFVMSGECKIKMKGSYVQLVSGEYADLPEGTYHLTAGKKQELYKIMVWEIPQNPRR